MDNIVSICSEIRDDSQKCSSLLTGLFAQIKVLMLWTPDQPESDPVQLDEVSPGEIIRFLIPVTQDFEFFFWLLVVTSCQCHRQRLQLWPDTRQEVRVVLSAQGRWTLAGLPGHRFLPRKVCLISSRKLKVKRSSIDFPHQPPDN